MDKNKKTKRRLWRPEPARNQRSLSIQRLDCADRPGSSLWCITHSTRHHRRHESAPSLPEARSWDASARATLLAPTRQRLTSSWARPSWARPSQARPSQVRPSQARPSQGLYSQAQISSPPSVLPRSKTYSLASDRHESTGPCANSYQIFQLMEDEITKKWRIFLQNHKFPYGSSWRQSPYTKLISLCSRPGNS